ncbi:diguanylate cyclase [Stappia sp.]|uniref:diguanylate cyclase n=1 Tax=Stappia sp. TaxID=1870903 RepID=UPI0032D993E3
MPKTASQSDIATQLRTVGARWVILAVVAGVLALGLALTAYVAGILNDTAREYQKNNALDRLSQLRARIEGEINATIYIAQGLVSFTAINMDLNQRQFAQFAAEIAAVDPNIKVIALAPDNVVRFIYPQTGNEKALGLDYRENAAQWPAVERVMRERRTIVAGPVDLVQGGHGLIARSPILVPSQELDARDGRAYWGLAAIVVDTDALFAQAGIMTEAGGYAYAIRGKDGLGAEGEMIFGDPALFDSDAVTLPVTLPTGSWQLASRPVRGWVRMSQEGSVAVVFGLALTLVMAALSGFVVRTQQRARALALHDDLTGLPNRRLLIDRMEQLASLSERTGIGFQVFFIDVNRFKPINDTFGHAVGDRVLREIGERLRAETRESDTIARIGGDEFVVVVPGLINHPATAGLAERLRGIVDEPLRIDEHTIVLRVSVGWATYPDDATSISDILALADQRMYREKDRAA